MKRLLVISLIACLSLSCSFSSYAKDTSSSSSTNKSSDDKSIKTVTPNDKSSKSEDVSSEESTPKVSTIGALDSGDVFVFLSEDGETAAKLEIPDEVWREFIDKFYYKHAVELGPVNNEDLSYPTVKNDLSSLDTYDNVTVNGDSIRKAIKDFKQQDIAIVVQTEKLAGLSENWASSAINYGAMLTCDGKTPNGNNNAPQKVSSSETSIINKTCKEAYRVEFSTKESEGKALCVKPKSSYYNGELYTNGSVVRCDDTSGMNQYGNACYVDAKDKFTSTLIKNTDGDTIGIFFRYYTESKG